MIMILPIAIAILDVLIGVLTMDEYNFDKYRPVLVKMIQNAMDILRRKYKVGIQSYIDDKGYLVVTVYNDEIFNRTTYTPEVFGEDWNPRFPYGSINRIYKRFTNSVMLQISSIKSARIIKWGVQ